MAQDSGFRVWPKAMLTVAWGNAPGIQEQQEESWLKAMLKQSGRLNMAFGQTFYGGSNILGRRCALALATVSMAFGHK